MSTDGGNDTFESQKINYTAFPSKLNSDNVGELFDRERRTWNSKAVVAALRDGLDPDILWTKEDLVSTRDVTYEDAWTHWNTPLHLTIRASDQDSAETILWYGGDVNIYNHRGHTALHEAITHRQQDDVWFLIRHGADPNKPSRDGHVPLHLALREGDEELFFDLLKHGASLQAAAYSEWSIVDLALLASERGILARLMSDEHNEHTLLPTPLLNCSESCHQSQPSNFAAVTSELLAVSLSDRIIPPKDLYKVYRFLLHSLHFPKYTSWEAEAVDSLIESFVASLYKFSNIPNLAATERFCPACLTFQSVAARSSSESIEIHKNKAELEECALAGCPLCALVADWVYESERFSTYTEVDGKWKWLQDEAEACLECSPITLELDKTLRSPPGELPPRVDLASPFLKGLSPSLDDQDPLKVWQAQVQEFTRRPMTKPSDRIPAFLAISKSIAMGLKDEFVGGIWKGENHLLESLCWKLRQPDTTDPRGPTWTWASRSGEASYDLLEHEGKKTRKAQIVSCDAEANRSQSQVFGSITLKGTLKLVQYDSSHGRPGYVFSDHVSGSKQKFCCCVFDMIEFGDPPLAYAYHGPRPGNKEKGRICLLLQSVDGNGDFRTASAFRRVGIEFSLWRDHVPYWKWHAKLRQRMLEGIDQDSPPSVKDKARPEEISSSSSEDDDRIVTETLCRRETKEVQTNRIVTIF
ncbi:Ankyrin-repeat domain containing transcription coregulator asaA [Diaporthe eres]|nr:Ankyrin-repeat domain containing transcription coregulator asaA [Diaporthe eres]